MPKVLKSLKKAKSTSTKPFPVDYYSASAIIKFSSNPLLFKIQYVNRDRFDTTMNISGVIGSTFHHAMHVYSGGSEEYLPSNESEAIEYGLKAGMDYLDKYNDGFITYSKDVPNKQKAFDLFSYAFNSYVQYAPYGKNEVIAVEDEIKEEIDVEWRGKKLTLPVPLKGFIDMVYKEDGKLKIKDYKTCRSFSNPEKIDGAKIIQAVTYYLLAYAKYKEEPYSVTFEEVKLTKNQDGSPQVREYEMVFAENELYFDFYFRIYEDITRALNGEMVYVPNVHTLFDNEVSIVSYIHRLDVAEDMAKLMKKHKVSNVSDLLKKQIQSAGNMRKLMKSVEANFITSKNIDYTKMKTEEKIQTKMLEHGMALQFDSVINGPQVDLYCYNPSIGLKMARLKGYVADIEQVIGKSGIRVLAPIPNSTMVGFEVPRDERTFVKLPKGQGFEISIGQTIMNQPRRFDIRNAPHMMVAGASGSGKSVFLNSVIEQLGKIENVDLHLFDPKLVELSQYEDIAVEYQSDAKKINAALYNMVELMNTRYKKMQKAGVRNISDMPDERYHIVVIDEFGDLILSENVQQSVLAIAQKGRAAGIHLIIATQRPSTDVIKGTIKANFPTKVVFRTAKAIDSQVIIDEPGAEKLLGKGDMLFAGEHGIERLQGYLV